MKIVHRLVLIVALVFAACSDRPSKSDTTIARADVGSASRDTLPWVVTFSGFGPVRIGDSVDSLQVRLGAPPRPGTRPAPEQCEYVGIPDSPLTRDVGFMVVQDTVRRVDIDSLPVATQWGDRVGDTEEAVMVRHAGRIQVEPHPYTGPEGHYLVVTPPTDTLLRLILETDGRRVVRYRAGRRPYVDWIEGCS